MTPPRRANFQAGNLSGQEFGGPAGLILIGLAR
jgi:hypothetical protein